MKKIIVFVILIINLIGFGFGYNLTSKEKIFLNKIQLKIVSQSNKNGINFLNAIEYSLSSTENNEYKNLKPEIKNEILEFIKEQKKYFEIDDKGYSQWIENESQKTDENNFKEQIRDLRLNLVNAERAKRGKNKLEISKKLNWTATIWANEMRNKLDMTHKRSDSDSYYSYKSIKEWFEDLKIRFKLINKSTFSENIGYGYFYGCETDCKKEVIKSITDGFQMMMDEEFQDYKAHYLTIINNDFQIIGFGVNIDINSGLVYYAIHYGTQLE